MSHLFVNVDGVGRPLVTLRTHIDTRHCLEVLQADDDDNQVIFLWRHIQIV